MAAGNLLSAGHVAGSGQETLHLSGTAKVCYNPKATVCLVMELFRCSLSELSVFASSSLLKHLKFSQPSIITEFVVLLC